MTSAIASGSPPQADSLADALRRNEIDAFEAASDFAACLLPLLSELDWDRNTAALMRALPHVASRIDLIDLRNIMVELGYRSVRSRGRASAIDPRLMPCLFLPSDGSPPLVLLDQRGRSAVFFDSERRKVVEERLGRLSGYYYTFETEAEEADGPGDRVPWFSGLLRRFRREAWLIAGASVLSSAFGLVVPLFVLAVYDLVVPASSARSLYWILPGVALALVIDLGLRQVRGRAVAHVAGRIDFLLSTELLRKILGLPVPATQSSTVSAQIGRFRSFQSLRDIAGSPVLTLILEIPVVLAALGLIGLIAGSVVLVPLAGLVTFALLAAVFVPAIRRSEQRGAEAKNRRDHIAGEVVGQQRAIRGIGIEAAFLERVRPFSARTSIERAHSAMLILSLQALCQGVTLALTVGTLLIGAYGVMAGTVTTGALVASMALVARVLAPVQVGLQALPRMAQLRATVDQVDRLMRTPTEPDRRDARVGAVRFGGHISIRRLSVRYREDSEPALLAASVEIEPGELIALSGPSGAGKSTLLKVIAGLLRPQAGTVFFGGVEQRQLSPVEQRRHVAFLSQSCDLFHGTILQNLRLARPDATDSDIREACGVAGLLDEIAALDLGFETRIGDEKLDRLPESFRQKLSLARLWLKDAPILLLDEPVQNLDDVGNVRLVERLQALRGRRTVIFVTHRPSTMRLADRVLHLEGGRLTEPVARPRRSPEPRGEPAEPALAASGTPKEMSDAG